MAMPERMCVCCRRRGSKTEFIRIVRNADGTVRVTDGGYAPGRGAYICRSAECAMQAKKKKALNRAFRENVSDEVYDELLSIIDGGGYDGCKD